jgi:hypothetical protein
MHEPKASLNFPLYTLIYVLKQKVYVQICLTLDVKDIIYIHFHIIPQCKSQESQNFYVTQKLYYSHMID